MNELQIQVQKNFLELAKIREADKLRRYLAAKTSRLTGEWIPVNQDINSLIRTDSPLIRARARQLVRDFPYFQKAIKIHTDFTVGSGIKFQSRVKLRSGKEQGELDKPTIQKIEDAVKWWMDEADIAGRLHYFELERLAKRQDFESGEFLFIKKFLPKEKARGRFIPFGLQAIEADWLTSLHTRVDKNNLVDSGIEYDIETGQVVAYHFIIPSGFNSQLTGVTKTTRVEAKDVIHGFQTLRPGQLRGISHFTTAIIFAHDLHDFLGAEIDGAKLAARYLGLITTADPKAFQNLRTKDGTGVDEGKKLEEIEGAIFEYLKPGESVEFAKHDRPGGTFEPFTKFVLRLLSVATNSPYEMLTNDYTGVNYSTLRSSRNDMAAAFKPQIKRHVRQFSRPAIYSAMDVMVLTGKLQLRNYFQNPRVYQESAFTGPGIASVDPLRETKAAIDQIKTGLKSPQQIVAERGGDFEETARETATAKELFDELKLEWMPAKTSNQMQQNPGKLGASEGDSNATT